MKAQIQNIGCFFCPVPRDSNEKGMSAIKEVHAFIGLIVLTGNLPFLLLF